MPGPQGDQSTRAWHGPPPRPRPEDSTRPAAPRRRPRCSNAKGGLNGLLTLTRAGTCERLTDGDSDPVAHWPIPPSRSRSSVPPCRRKARESPRSRSPPTVPVAPKLARRRRLVEASSAVSSNRESTQASSSSSARVDGTRAPPSRACAPCVRASWRPCRLDLRRPKGSRAILVVARSSMPSSDAVRRDDLRSRELPTARQDAGRTTAEGRGYLTGPERNQRSPSCRTGERRYVRPAVQTSSCNTRFGGSRRQ